MATIYVSPLGGGNGSGSSAANAKSFAQLNGAVKAAGAGGTVLLLADQGNYKAGGVISLTAGGLAGAPVTLKGVDSSGQAMDIQIHGTRPAYSPSTAGAGQNVIRLLDGASNLTFEGFDFYNVQSAFTLAANIKNITIQNMEGDNVRYFINNNAAPSSSSPIATVSGLTIRDVEVHGFSKSVVKLQYDTNNVLLDNVYGDSEYQDRDAYAMGVMLSGTVHGVVIKNSTMINCIATAATGSYWNGDGFNTERGVYNVRFENTYASGNGDAGYDLKSSNTVLVNAAGEDNNRNFRLWGTNVQLIDPVGIDPHTRGGSGGQAQVWIDSSANVKIIGGYFVDSGSATQVFVNDGGVLTTSGTNVWHASNGVLKKGSVGGLNLALVHEVGSTGKWSKDGEKYLPDGVGPNSALSLTTASDSLTLSTAERSTAGDLDGTGSLIGTDGSDTLPAGRSNDLLSGGGGADRIAGGVGNDLFDFNAISEFAGIARATLVDFKQDGSKLDMVGLDLNAGELANLAFALAGGTASSGPAGQLRLGHVDLGHVDPAKTVVHVDGNGDGAELASHVTTGVPFNAGDFLV